MRARGRWPFCPRRSFSANEAAVALRPFYFAVHPDRFGMMPTVRSKNEKSLQIFNGFLNDLFPRPTISSHRPIQVDFSIVDRTSGSIKDISLSLAGTDPVNIVRHALESCELPTNQLPPPSATPHPSTSASSSLDFVAEYLKRKKKQAGNDVAAVLKRGRHDALTKAKQFEVTRQTLKEEIEDIKLRTGVKKVTWQMDWAASHMRRCLSGVQRLLDHASKSERDLIICTLLNNILRFGRGSFICCDGSVQFGADNVPEQWQQVCCEAGVRRRQLGVLQQTGAALSRVLGGAEVLMRPEKGLEQTLHQLSSLLTRISNRPAEDCILIAKLASSTLVEVMTSYDELSLGHDGRLFIPCNVDVTALVSFLKEWSGQSRQVNQKAIETAALLETRKSAAVSELKLAGLDWEASLPLRGVLAALSRLCDAPSTLTEQLHSLHLSFSANPTVHIRSDGKLSLPLDWT